MKLPFALLVRLRGDSSFALMARVVMTRSLSLGVTVFTGLLTAAVLGPAGRGEQAALIVAPQFLAGLASLGLHASLIYNMRRDPEHEREYFGANLIMTFLSASIVAGIGWVLEPYWLRSYGSDTIMLARTFLCATPILATSWSLRAAAEVRGWFDFSNRLVFLQNIGILATLLVIIHLGWLTPGRSAAIYIVSNVPVFVCLGFRTHRRIRPILTLRTPFPGRLLHYGLRFYGVDLLGTLSGYLDQIVIVALLPPSAVGIYVVARSVARILGVVSEAVASVLFPRIIAKPAVIIVEMVAKALRVTNIISVAPALVLGVAAPFLVKLVYGQQFADVVAPMRILIASTLLVSSARLLYQAYAGSGRPEAITAFEAIGTAVSFVAMLGFVPLFGLIGAACAILLASMVRLACALAGLRIVLGVPVPRLVFAWSDVRSAINR